MLQQVAQAIDQLDDRRVQSNLSASAYVLAGLILEKEVIRRILRRDLMQESVTYQEILEEGREKGVEEGSRVKAQQIAINLLGEGMSLDLIARATGLTIEEIQQLSSSTFEQGE
ncbi:hypothetical protein ACN4EK_05615 [Pantanalinema rosaneae CENA516]|uniref:hypothetical protein n=1 Tax=Pantanalinema rosaneae TaxID=1620701 RepID=UPI003D6EF5BE